MVSHSHFSPWGVGRAWERFREVYIYSVEEGFKMMPGP